MKADKLTFAEIVNGGKATVNVLPNGYEYKLLAEAIECSDGTSLSVQASEAHYCTPRNNYGPYTHVEVGFPTAAPPDSWSEYFDGDWETDDHTQSVYGYIPVELVIDYIAAHGGEKPNASNHND